MIEVRAGSRPKLVAIREGSAAAASNKARIYSKKTLAAFRDKVE
jgi:hypothetical protein